MSSIAALGKRSQSAGRLVKRSTMLVLTEITQQRRDGFPWKVFLGNQRMMTSTLDNPLILPVVPPAG